MGRAALAAAAEGRGSPSSCISASPQRDHLRSSVMASCLSPAGPGPAAALLMSRSISLRVLLTLGAQGLSRLTCSAPWFKSLPREMEEPGAARPGKNSKDSLWLTLPSPGHAAPFPCTNRPQASFPSFPTPGSRGHSPPLGKKLLFSREIAQNTQDRSIPTALQCVPPLMEGGQRAEIWEKKGKSFRK